MADILAVELQAKVSNFVAGMRKAASETEGAGKRIDKSVNSISSAVTGRLAGAFSAAAFIGFGKAVLDVTAEFQKFNAVLGNTLGSASLATLKLREIQDFAAKTPFAITELTGAFVKLANSGFKPTGDQMRALGDLASSTGKSFDQLAEAILDAQSGEFERLKEFGVRAKDAGDSVIFTYKGVQTQVEKTSEAIRGYVTNLGNAQGVSGSMAKISQTLGGQISNLGDNWDKMLLSVGNNTTGVFNSAISGISKAIDKITQYNEELEIASKYDLGSKTGDFLKQMNRAINPFASKGATTMELGVSGIKEANNDVSKFVGNALAAAKSTADFGKALSDLKKQGDTALKSPGIGSEEERRGIKDAYQLGVKAIQDARANFSGEASKVGANFGTSKAKKEVKELTKDVKELYTLVDNGSNGVSRAIARNALKNTPTGDPQLEREGIVIPSLENSSRVKEYNALLAEQEQFKQDYTEGFRSLSQGAVSDAIGGGFSAIGEALAGGGSIIEAAGNALLGTLNSFLNDLGQMLIKKGLATVLAGTALNFLFPGSGAKTTAGGFGLIAAGAALSLGSGIIGSGRSSSGKQNNNGPTAFAEGGIVSGPTFGLIGEYSGAKNNPEVVAPLSKLKSMIGGGDNHFEVIPLVNSQQLAIMVRSGNKLLNRVG